jgi:hypothetical protein
MHSPTQRFTSVGLPVQRWVGLSKATIAVFTPMATTTAREQTCKALPGEPA